jgi:peptidoglycan-N-acetylmuramic acid deacetylase
MKEKEKRIKSNKVINPLLAALTATLFSAYKLPFTQNPLELVSHAAPPTPTPAVGPTPPCYPPYVPPAARPYYIYYNCFQPAPAPMPIPTEIPQTPESVDYHLPIYWGNRTRSEIALTFDDGFDAASIRRVLNVMNNKGIDCTFFVIGSALKNNPELWQEAVADGHQVCNHTYGHPMLSNLSPQEIKAELDRWEETAGLVLGEEYLEKMRQEFPFMRCPYGAGHGSSSVIKTIVEEGYLPIAWSAETYNAVIRNHDYMKEDSGPIAQEIVAHVTGTAQKGLIILLHFTVWDTLYIGEIIDGIAAKGYSFKTVSEVMK